MATEQLPLMKPGNPVSDIISGIEPYYYSTLGGAYIGDCLDLMKSIPSEKVDLIVTSPPYALTFKKEYGNVGADEYPDWFMPFAEEFHRILKEEGSLVINIGGSWRKGSPTRNLYQFTLLQKLTTKFHFAQEFFWYNPAKLPSPAEWVNVRRIRVKDAVEYIWWLSKSEFPKADNRRVLQPYSDDMKYIIKNGYRVKTRPSGHNITNKFQKDNEGAIPPNLLIIGNTDSSSRYIKECERNGIKPHPARFPKELPDFFIRFLTERGDIVMDPFAGSNVTGMVAELLKRRWIAIELAAEYLDGSKFRFDAVFS